MMKKLYVCYSPQCSKLFIRAMPCNVGEDFVHANGTIELPISFAFPFCSGKCSADHSTTTKCETCSGVYYPSIQASIAAHKKRCKEFEALNKYGIPFTPTEPATDNSQLLTPKGMSL